MATIFHSSDKSQALRIPKAVLGNSKKSKKVSRSRHGNESVLVTDNLVKSSKFKNVALEVLAKTGEDGKPCPDISGFFKGDDEQFKETF